MDINILDMVALKQLSCAYIVWDFDPQRLYIMPVVIPGDLDLGCVRKFVILNNKNLLDLRLSFNFGQDLYTIANTDRLVVDQEPFVVL
jgi:hypothetical protein